MKNFTIDVQLDFDSPYYNECVFDEFTIRLSNAIKAFMQNNIIPIKGDLLMIEDERQDIISFVIMKRKLYAAKEANYLWYSLKFADERVANRLNKKWEEKEIEPDSHK